MGMEASGTALHQGQMLQGQDEGQEWSLLSAVVLIRSKNRRKKPAEAGPLA